MDEKRDRIDPLHKSAVRKDDRPQVKVNRWALLLGVLVIIILAAFVVRPTILGYGVYQQVAESGLQEYSQSVGSISEKLTAAEANLTAYGEFNEQLLNRINEVADDVVKCATEKESCLQRERDCQQNIADKDIELNNALAGMEDKVAEKVEQRTEELKAASSKCQEELLDKEDEADTVQDNFDLFSRNVARTVCCKEKVDDPSIKSYEIVDNKLVCRSEGGIELTC